MTTETPGRGEKIALTAIVAGVLGLGLWHLLGPEERIGFLFYDDAYYYFQVARNVAAGLGSTFDGLHPTNGYHPLWCALLVPIFALASDPSTALRIITAVWFALAAAAGVALWWAVRPRTGPSGAIAAAALFALAPRAAIGLARPNGLETPLYALLCALTIGYFERVFAGRDAAERLPRRAAIAGLGVLLGLVVLARLDGGALAVATALGVFWVHRRAAGVVLALRRVVLLTAAACAIAGPALIWNAVAFGSPVPVSGRVVALEAAQERSDLGGVSSPAMWERRGHHTLVGIPTAIGRALVEDVPVLRRVVPRSPPAAAALAAALVALSILGLAVRRRRGRPESDAVALAIVFAAIHLAIYGAWLWTPGESRYRAYYFMPQVLAAFAAMGAALGAGFDAVARRRAARILGGAALVAVVGLHLASVSRAASDAIGARPGRLSDRFIYGWVRAHLPPDAVLGARDAGKLGFFCGRRVVNLDGLANGTSFFDALRDDRVDTWIAASPIDYLLFDRPWLGGFDPARPDVRPEEKEGLGPTLWRLHALGGVDLRQVAAAQDDWVVLEVVRGEPLRAD